MPRIRGSSAHAEPDDDRSVLQLWDAGVPQYSAAIGEEALAAVHGPSNVVLDQHGHRRAVLQPPSERPTRPAGKPGRRHSLRGPTADGARRAVADQGNSSATVDSAAGPRQVAAVL